MKKIKSKYIKTQLVRIPTEEGESIEEMIRRQTADKTPIEANAPMIYTAKKDGVIPQYDPRTDKQEFALDAVDKYQKSAAMQTDDEPDFGEENKPTEIEIPK